MKLHAIGRQMPALLGGKVCSQDGTLGGVQATEEEAMRGFKVERRETREVTCQEPLLYYVRDAATSTAPLAAAQH